MISLQQKRAAFALRCVTELLEHEGQRQENQRCNKEFVSYASSLAAMIYQNGFGQTVAFCLAKGSGTDNSKARAYKRHYDILQGWLCGDSDGVYYDEKEPRRSLISAITSEEMEAYRAAENEAIELMVWIKKFSKAYLEE